MKRKFTRLTAALALLVGLVIPLGMWGQTTASVTFSEQGYTNQQEITEVTFGGVTANFDKGTNNNAPKYYTNGSAIRVYGGNTVAISAGNNTITAITIAFGSGDGSNTITSNVGTYENGSWNGNATSVTFTIGGTSGNRRFAGLSVTYTGGGTQPTTYTVTYNANGGTGEMTDLNSPYEEDDVVTLLTNEFTAPEGKMWDSWSVKDADDNTITVTNNQFAMPASNVTVTAQWVVDPSAPQYEWVLTDWADLTGDDIFVIVGNNSKAMANEASTSNPSAVAVTIQNEKITTDVTDNMKWNRVAVDGGYKLLPNGSTTTWLNNPSSTSLRIDDATSNNVFTYVTNSSNNYLKVGDRYAIIYNNDWRAYTSVSSYTTNTTFYRRQLVSTDPAINASNINITYDATSGTINYTIDNPDPDATIQAIVADGATITNLVLGTPGADAVSFTCDANSSTTTTRTAEVTLNYVKNNDVLATKSVTITQAAAPVIYSTIPALFDAATSTETNVLVTFDNWVVSGVSTNGKNVFVTDNNGNGFVIFDNNGGLGNTYTAGDILAGTAVSCNLKKYNGFAELLNVDANDLTITAGGTIAVANVAMADLAGVNTGALVHYDNLTCSVNNNKYYLSDGTTTLQVYNSLYAFDALTDGNTYNITGVYQQFNSTKEVLPRSADDIEEVTSATPTITVSNATVNAPAEGAEGTLTVTYENITTVVADVWFCDAAGTTTATYNWITADINAQNNVEYLVESNNGEARTAYFKVYAMDAETNLVYSNLVTVTQAAAPAMALYTYSINGVEGQTLEAEVGTPVTLAAGENLNNNFTFAGWTTDADDVENRVTEYTFNENEVVTFYAVYAHTTGGAATMTIDSQTDNFPKSYGQANTFTEYTLNGEKFMIQQVYINGDKLQFRAAGNSNGTGTIYNSESLGTISSIILNYNSSDNNKNFTITAGSGSNPTQGTSITPTINQNEYTFDLSAGNYSYFVLTNGSNAGYLDNIIINYSGGVTTYYTRVFLNETVAADITIAGPSIVPNGQTLNMGTFILNSDTYDNLIIEDGGQLKIANQVNGTIQKNVAGYGTSTNDNYVLLATPASMDACNNTGMWPTTGSDHQAIQANIDFYSFDQSAELEWQNFKHGQTSFAGPYLMQRGQGYLYANPNDVTLTLQTRGYSSPGIDYQAYPFEPTDEPYTVPSSELGYTATATWAGWNLVGNPFTCDAYLNRTYFRMNDTGDAIVEGDGAIKPCEGVFVVVTAEDKVVKFSDTPWLTSPSLSLNLNDNNQLMDRVSLHFDGSNNIKKFVLNENASKLYIQQGTIDYAVVRSNAEGEMPVSFKAENNGSYTISVNAENVEMNYLHLIDNLTGTDIDLLVNPSYSFEAKTTDYASRFRLVFNANTVNENGNETFAYFNGSEWVISNMGEATLQVVDMLGRVISAETVSGNATMNTSSLSAGIYTIRLINGNDVKVQKIVVR